MANKQRHRRFSQDVLYLPAASATVIEQGDLVAYDAVNHAAYPASSQAWNTDLATTQGDFADNFVGVAVTASPEGSDEVAVATGGVFEMECAPGTFDPGDPVAPADSGAGSLEDQKVVKAAAAASVGVVVKRYGADTSSVLVRIASGLVPCSANASLG